LTTTGNARQKHADIRNMMMWGNLIDAQKSAGRSEDEAPALVPKSWELIRRSPDTTEQIVARGVLCFDLYADGSVIYSNGSGIFHAGQHGSIQRLAKEALIEQVIALEE
jgi:hypothetical protein